MTREQSKRLADLRTLTSSYGWERGLIPEFAQARWDEKAMLESLELNSAADYANRGEA